MFVVYDTFNLRPLSRHRTVKGAIASDARIQRRIERNEGRGHYIPTELRRELKYGVLVRVEPDSPEQNEWLYRRP